MNQWRCGHIQDDTEIGSWVTHPGRYRFTPCDRCGKRRLFLRLYDVWPSKTLGYFFMVCADCLIEVISDIATGRAR